jgi:hypothetical protein
MKDKLYIKIKLELHNKVVIMEVLEQKGIKTRDDNIFKNNEMSLKSISYPDLGAYLVLIRGSDKRNDNVPGCITFKTKKEAKEYYNRVIQLFRDFNNRDNRDKKDERVKWVCDYPCNSMSKSCVLETGNCTKVTIYCPVPDREHWQKQDNNPNSVKDNIYILE